MSRINKYTYLVTNTQMRRQVSQSEKITKEPRREVQVCNQTENLGEWSIIVKSTGLSNYTIKPNR